MGEAWLYIGFITFVIIMLVLDLGVFHRHAKEIGVKQALMWTAFWVSLAACFVPIIYLIWHNNWFGMAEHKDTVFKVARTLTPKEAMLAFISGYLIEESLSLDNVFVIALILTYFGVPGKYQHRVLFWGIVGAVILRGIMIGVGAALVHKFAWMNYVFGGILLLTTIKLMRSGDEEVDLNKNPVVKFAKRFLPVTDRIEGEKFFLHIGGKRYVTPLFLALLVVEFTDVIFAVDSIPAIFGVTTIPFIVFTSNVFAILGLRSLYFALAAMMRLFRYLKVSLIFLLGFVSIKLLISNFVHINVYISLSVIITILAAGVIASLVMKNPEEEVLESSQTFEAESPEDLEQQ